MSRIYPNIDGKWEARKGVCLKCKVNLSDSNVGTRFSIEWDYMNGNDEEELYCKQHAAEREAGIRELHQKVNERKYRERERQSDHKDSLLERLVAKYEVRILTPYQWRINGVLDVYPVNRNWHDIKRNKRGMYNDVLAFCDRYFRPSTPS